MDVATIVRPEKANAQRPTLNAQLAEVRLKAGVEIDPCAPAHLKLAPSPTRSLLPSQFYLLCRFSQKLHSTSRCAHLCLARRSLGEGGSLASPTAPFASGRSDNG